MRHTKQITGIVCAWSLFGLCINSKCLWTLDTESQTTLIGQYSPISSNLRDSFKSNIFRIEHLHNRNRRYVFAIHTYKKNSIDSNSHRCFQVLASWTMRGMFFFGSFHRIKISGRQVSSKEAPILVLAPHSSFFDSIAVIAFGPPSVLAKAETAFLPFFGSKRLVHKEWPVIHWKLFALFAELTNFTQPIYVWREDPNSRQNTIKTIIERANSNDNWPQVIIVMNEKLEQKSKHSIFSQIIIFPEGTCTNRSCLLSFKAGAFYPGVPVQPVCIKYPNALDTVTWTWEGPGAYVLNRLLNEIAFTEILLFQ